MDEIVLMCAECGVLFNLQAAFKHQEETDDEHGGFDLYTLDELNLPPDLKQVLAP